MPPPGTFLAGLPRKSIVYEMSDFDLQHFESCAKDDGIHYWHATELMPGLGYETWASFHRVINKAIAACAQLGINVHDVFIPETLVDGQKVLQSYKLTRFACFLVTMHADSKKPEVAQAKVALADLADTLVGD